jgi:uncharacterized damage-inducible protein DinB
MDPLFVALADRLEAMHRAIDRAIAELPDEALDWVPGPEMNSIAVLLAHTFGSERYWIGDIAGRDPSGRVREKEFATRGVGVAEFLRQSKDTLAHSQSVLARLLYTELGDMRSASISDRQVTVAWAILHALEHVAVHVGHIEITRQLWEQRGSDGV